MPYFVSRKDSISNTIFVAKGKLNTHLWKDTFVLDSFNTINSKNLNIKNGLTAMVRYRSKEIKCDVSWDLRTVYLKEKVWTPSLDQSLVIYKGDECIGGGKIKEIRQ
jgi:tRNA U34 2-thiouridine synthase MnmA/TrmU